MLQPRYCGHLSWYCEDDFWTIAYWNIFVGSHIRVPSFSTPPVAGVMQKRALTSSQCGRCLALPSVISVDDLARHEANLMASEGRISNCFPYHSKSFHASVRSKGLLYLHARIDSPSNDLSCLRSPVTEYAGVALRLRVPALTIVSA